MEGSALTPMDTASALQSNSVHTQATATPANPFVGLRPFNSDEGILFFGRREQTTELLQQLHHTRFLAVVGSSGCGKSSLIRAGLIPQLQAGFLVEDRDQWHIATMKPGDTPLRNLACAMSEATSAEPPGVEELDDVVEAMRVAGAQALIERLTPTLGVADLNLLLLIDQFEEIFRFGWETDKPECRDEAADFVTLMLGLAEQQALPIYVVMTMRSDFLGDCDHFYGLPEAMNRSQYLVPRLTRQQRQQAIEGPIRLFGQTVTPTLLDRVLNDAGDQADQLPVMQHALMRTWENWQQTRDGPLDLPHYRAIGTIKEALSQDADQALAGMSAAELEITKRLFQALTDTDARNRRIRRPAHLSEIQAITSANRAQILQIIERFRGSGRSFLNLYEDKLGDDPLVDISHESLIRQWQRLRNWVDQEATSRTMYLRIVDTATRYHLGQAKLWDNPDLAFALQWREKNTPNRAWAQRYHAEFDSAMAFLDQSRKRRRYKVATILLLLATAIVSSVFLLNHAQQKRLEAEKVMQQRMVAAEQERLKAAKVMQQAEQERLEAKKHDLEIKQAQTANLITGEGIEKAAEDKFDDAITAYEKAVAIKSDYVPAYYHLGVAYLRKGDKENALKNFEQVKQLTTDEERRKRAESFIRDIESPPTSTRPSHDQATADKRVQLVKDMFSEDKATRITATTALIAGWKQDPQLVPLVVKMAQENTANRSGVINALVVLESVDPKLLMPYRSELNRLLSAVEGNGRQTLEHVQKLREVKGLGLYP